MMHKKTDIVIVGSGLGGLVSAVILSKEGHRVCVLEKNNQFGGNLQTFVRDKNIFDTGVHYLGGLDEGQNLNSYFRYLGIMDELRLKRLEKNHYDVICFGNDPVEYPHAQGHENFVRQLGRYFPEEKKALKIYIEKIREICAHFPFYNLQPTGTAYFSDYEMLSLKAKDFIDSVTKNEKLRAVLAGSNLLYAGDPDKTPLYVHALSVNSYIESAWKCVGGGSQIAKSLVKKIRENGGEVLKYQEVEKFFVEEGFLKSVKTKKGDVFSADIFISNIEPKQTLDLIGRENIRKSYYKRVKAQKNGISAFSLYLVFKPKTMEYLNYNIYYNRDLKKVWTGQVYTEKTWPESLMISMAPDLKNPGFAKNLTSICYMRYEEMKKWENSFNTVVEENGRGKGYEDFKAEKTKVFLDVLEEKFPHIRNCVQSVHASTPLSYRDYIGSVGGAMYGYEKDAEQPLRSFLSPRTKIKNLFLTGQNLNMHGILGVTITAVSTCGEIVGRDYLMEKICAATNSQQQEGLKNNDFKVKV